MLELHDLHKDFGGAEIIRGVSLAVVEGERHAIIGPNGAGKSTLYNLITGRATPTRGSIRFRGQEIGGLQPFEINRLGITRSFQVTNIFPTLTLFENIRCALMWTMGYRYSFWHRVGRLRALNRRTGEVLEEIGLADKRHLAAGILTYAEQRALELGIAIAGGAELILLDEPVAGMSHTEMDQAVALIRRISESRTLVVVEHDMGVVFDLADRISVLVYGEVIATDTPEAIGANPAVQEAYLGTLEQDDA